MVKVGDRVGAVLSSEGDTVKFLGYGIYEGEFIPEEAIGMIGRLCVEARRTNPRIRLDSGKVVYGCECWWGSEDKVKDKLELYKNIIDVDIEEVRDEFR